VTIDNKTVEIPDDEHPREQAELLKSQLPKLIDTISQINELAIRLGHDPIHHAAKEMFEGEGHHAKGFGKWAGNLVELQNVLVFAQGVLTLTDKEFQHELHHFSGVFAGIANYTELVQAGVEITGGAVALTGSFAAAIAKRAATNADAVGAGRRPAPPASCSAKSWWHRNRVGIATLLDSHASSGRKSTPRWRSRRARPGSSAAAPRRSASRSRTWS
jgi:hypothetical protein